VGGHVGGVAQAVVAVDFDAALEHQHQAEAGLARLENHLAVAAHHVAEALHVADVGRAQRGEHLVPLLEVMGGRGDGSSGVSSGSSRQEWWP
jgi:hypothetical protein